jgi:ferredoxin
MFPATRATARASGDVGDQYARGTRSSFSLANWIRSQGYNARAFPGPSADALLLIPPAVASGLGELGKHGSMISRHFGAGVRLAGVTTDMLLVATAPDRFGGDDFCAICQACPRACPAGAISDKKQMVRGEEHWYVDFDKCIPAFTDLAGCAVCIAECPWTRPAARPKLLALWRGEWGGRKAPDGAAVSYKLSAELSDRRMSDLAIMRALHSWEKVAASGRMTSTQDAPPESYPRIAIRTICGEFAPHSGTVIGR